jgi:DNA-binding Lrp family transcriptional regulator
MKTREPESGGTIDAIDRRLIVATQGGLPLSSRPYHELAVQLGISPDEVMSRFQRMLDDGIIRRIGAVPNHYKLGYTANGMSVWDISDDLACELGARIGALDFVSHCYLRPRRLPGWPYNVFAMVHGRSRDEVEQRVRMIGELVDGADRGHAVLYSSRILKKTGMRLA